MALFLLVSYSAAASSWKFSSGFDYSSGSYGDAQDTEIVYFPTSVKYTSDLWSAKVTVPYVKVTGPNNVVGGLDGPIILARESLDSQAESESGVGDVVIALDWMLDTPWQGAPWIDLIGKVKVPTADEDKGLGTGAADTQVQMELTYVVGQFTPFISLGKKWRGDTSDTKLSNQLYGSLGSDIRLNTAASLGVIYDYREPSSAGGAPRSEILLYSNWKFSPSFSVNIYAIKGFSDASPDMGVGSQLSWSPQ